MVLQEAVAVLEPTFEFVLVGTWRSGIERNRRLNPPRRHPSPFTICAASVDGAARNRQWADLCRCAVGYFRTITLDGDMPYETFHIVPPRPPQYRTVRRWRRRA